MAGNLRLMSNNFASLTVNSFTYSSQKTGFEATNVLTDFRSQTWKPTGHFLIDATNNKLYFNDGANKVATVAVAAYSTPTSLATAVQAALNAVGSGFTVTYDTAGETYKFTITHSGSITLQLSLTTNAMWNTIGYTGSIDRVGTSFIADEQRNHTSEYLRFDFGYQADVSFIALIGDIAEDFKLSHDAIVTVEANNIDDFTSPPLSKTLTVTSKGIFEFLDDDFAPDSRYRFWRVEIVDVWNTGGPENIQIGNLYLGDYQTLENRNIQRGWSFTDVDPSTASESQAGIIYYDQRTKFRKLGGLQALFLDATDRDTLERAFFSVGTTTPFYISVDPLLCVSQSITDFTRYVLFADEPVFTHVAHNYFSTSLSFREVV